MCRKFLSEHAPKKADGETAGKQEPRTVSPAQLLYAKKIAQGKGLIDPDEAKANSARMSAWLDSNQADIPAQLALTSSGSMRPLDRKSTRLNSSHHIISYSVFC